MNAECFIFSVYVSSKLNAIDSKVIYSK